MTPTDLEPETTLDLRNSGDSDVGAPIASVIVPVRDDPAGLGRCLAALAAQTLPRHHFEVIVVDNGSEPPVAEVVSDFPFTEVLRESTPGSYAARNAGIALGRGEFLAFTDADCEPAPDWLERAITRFRAEPDIAALGGPIKLTVSPARRASELFEVAFPPFDQRHFVERLRFAATANLIMRRRTLDTVGPFDPSLVTGGDVEWGRRMARYGLRLAYDPAVVVIHPARQALSGLISRHRRLAGGRAGNSRGARFTDAEIRDRRRQNAKSLAILATRPGGIGLSRNESFKVLAVALVLAMARIGERARIYLGGQIVR